MKKRIIIGILAFIAILILINNTREAEYNGGFCKECGRHYREVGTVFPFTRYKCDGCGNIVLN